jgi:hypothetical protein
MEKHTIITLKLNGKSNHAVAKETGIHRKTVAKYWNEYQRLMKQIKPGEINRQIQEKIARLPQYDTTNRQPLKYTLAVDTAVNDILANEVNKACELGENNKQKLTNRQILGILKEQGHDIGITVLSAHIREKRRRNTEVFIRQEYDFGARLEYDFGEVKLVIGGVVGKYYLAVFGAPASGFRWAYLYKNQRKEVFLDSHARFFQMIGGVYREVVYDNMKNVVTRFIGKNEKELNRDLIVMSNYYGFIINVTNCFSGNEKGFVEFSVKNVRNEVFAVRYNFETLEDAEAYLEDELSRMNAESPIDEEKKCLQPWRPPLELSHMTINKVDSYSFVRVDNNYYSVPEYLVGRRVTVRRYIKEVVVYSGLNEVCSHERKDGHGEMSVNILHYLDTLSKKPGAIRNSKALRSEAELKAVFDKHYITRPREFIDILRANQDEPMDKIVNKLNSGSINWVGSSPETVCSNVLMHTKDQLTAISDFFMKGSAGYVH